MKYTYSYLIAFLFLISTTVTAQKVEKVMFVKPVPVKIQSKGSYSFMVGYIANKDRDINLELSNKELAFFANKKIAVKKGQGIINVKFSPPEQPKTGTGYKILLSLRESKGGWKTTKAATVISNVEFVNNIVGFSDTVSFSPLTPYSLKSSDTFNFDIDYNIAKENLVQVSIWDGNKKKVSSKRIKIPQGNGTQKIAIKTAPLIEGDNYKFMLTFGTKDEFDSQKTKKKERSGIHITKPVKKLTLKEINAKSIQISVNKESEILTLPGKLSYELIRIIGLNGQILLEVSNTNSIKISGLTKGAYFAITSENDFYKFVKF